MRIQTPLNEPIWTAEIDINDHEEYGKSITAIAPVIKIIKELLTKEKIEHEFNSPVIQGTENFHDISELKVSSSMKMDEVLAITQKALESQKIDWFEPYAMDPGSDFYRLVTMNVSIRK